MVVTLGKQRLAAERKTSDARRGAAAKWMKARQLPGNFPDYRPATSHRRLSAA